MDPEGDSILAEADTVVTEEVYDRLMAAHILEISLYPADEESGEEPETLAINVPEDKVKAAFREHMTHHFLDKQVKKTLSTKRMKSWPKPATSSPLT